MRSEGLAIILLGLVILASADIMRRAAGQIIRMRRLVQLRATMRRLRRPVQPWVTVIIYGKRDNAQYEASLRSVRRNRYHAYDIVTVGPRAKTYQTAYRKSQRGKLVIYLPAGCVVDRNFIKRAVALRTTQCEWRVAIELLPARVYGLLGILQELRDTVWARPMVVEASISAALRYKKIPDSRAVYSQKVVSNTLHVIAVLLIAIAVWYEGSDALWYIWVIVTIYLLILIWLRYETTPSERWKLSFVVPSALFLLPVSSIIVAFFQLFTRK